eukprot:COSAG01_NODE_4471_length_4996_cov_2.220339_1_plen_110_part_10
MYTCAADQDRAPRITSQPTGDNQTWAMAMGELSESPLHGLGVYGCNTTGRFGIRRRLTGDKFASSLCCEKQIDLRLLDAPVVGIEFTIERERRLVPVVETNCWELRPCFS